MGTVVLSAGGTGGHLFPAEALAQELLSRGHKVVIMTDKRGQAFKTLGADVAIHTVRAATFKPGVVRKLRAVAEIKIGVLQAIFLLLKHRPGVIVGFGGYPSFPAVFAGQLLGIPTVLHEQNAVLGKANAFLARYARAIAMSLPETRGIKDAGKVVHTGNPVRAEIVAVRDVPYAAPSGEINILVTGGSQAAGLLSQVVPDAAALLPEDMKKRLFVAHQARAGDIDLAAQKYKNAGVRAEVKTFFGDMSARLAACHLLIGRSGASTVAEVAVTGRPALFVPLRHKDMQQKFNAESVTAHGGGWMIMQEDFTAPVLAQKLQELFANPAILMAAAQASRACGQPDAAAKLADLTERCLKT